MQNYFKSNTPMKFQQFTKQFLSSVPIKSFVNSMPNMNVIQRRKHTHLVHPNEKF